MLPIIILLILDGLVFEGPMKFFFDHPVALIVLLLIVGFLKINEDDPVELEVYDGP